MISIVWLKGFDCRLARLFTTVTLVWELTGRAGVNMTPPDDGRSAGDLGGASVNCDVSLCIGCCHKQPFHGAMCYFYGRNFPSLLVHALRQILTTADKFSLFVAFAGRIGEISKRFEAQSELAVGNVFSLFHNANVRFQYCNL